MEATTWRGGLRACQLSDFGHIYDLKNKELRLGISKGGGEGGCLV